MNHPDLVVVVEHKQASVDMEGPTLRVRAPGQRLQRVPLSMLGLLVVVGNPQISCSVWRSLAGARIPAVIFPSRGKQPPAWLGSGLVPSARFRRLQYQAFEDPQTKCNLAVSVVRGKLEAQRSLLELISSKPERWGPLLRSSSSSAIHRTIRQLDNSLNRLNKAKTLDLVRGIEGQAAAAWFAGLKQMIPEEWGFRGRNRRPPQDPVNALLSLAYTLLSIELNRWVQCRGLDPCVGFLHEQAPSRPALALDLMEPLRPAVDAMVLQLIQGEMSPQDFLMSERDGCRLNANGRGVFFAAWATWRERWLVLHHRFTFGRRSPLQLNVPQLENDQDLEKNFSLADCGRRLLVGLINYLKSKRDEHG